MNKNPNQSVIASPANKMSGTKQSPNSKDTSIRGLLRTDGIRTGSKSVLAMTVVAVALFSSCNTDPQKPGWAYFPDMAYSQAYETYSANPNFEDGQTARQPVPGTIARGVLPDNPAVDDEAFEKSYFLKKYYPETPEGYEAAGAELKNPVTLNDQTLADGKKTYEIYCMVCHGEKGDGQGSIVQGGAFPPVSPYSTLLKDKQEGKMFHSITYGRNLMGSYAPLVSAEDRWKVIYYIQKLSGMGRYQSQPADSADASANAKTK